MIVSTLFKRYLADERENRSTVVVACVKGFYVQHTHTSSVANTAFVVEAVTAVLTDARPFGPAKVFGFVTLSRDLPPIYAVR